MGELYFKVLGEDGEAYHGGTGTWSLPTLQEDGTWEAGEWMPTIRGEIEPCIRGYHLARRQDLLTWLGPRIFVAEVKPHGKLVAGDDKVVVRTARLIRECTAWTERSARLFAVECVEHVLDSLKQQPPEIDKIRAVLNVVRRYANGQATHRDLLAAKAAAWDAAWAAAKAAASDAAWDAARYAAKAAAWDAAWAAPRAAAWAAEREWQTERLMELLGEKA